MAPNRLSAARLYAPVEVRPRPQWTTPAEQGKAGGPIPHFFAACAGGCRGVAPLPGIPVAAAQVGRFGVRCSSIPLHSSLLPLPLSVGRDDSARHGAAFSLVILSRRRRIRIPRPLTPLIRPSGPPSPKGRLSGGCYPPLPHDHSVFRRGGYQPPAAPTWVCLIRGARRLGAP